MKFLNQYYKNTPKLKFLAQAAILTFISDVINICYINLYYLPEKITANYIFNLYSNLGINPRQFNTTYIMELRQVLINSMALVFCGFLAYHILVYFQLSKDKKWAKKYVSGYAFTGAILTVIELPVLIQEHIGWAIAMLITTVIYVFSFMGIRFFKKAK